jgi:hypothetical protein
VSVPTLYRWIPKSGFVGAKGSAAISQAHDGVAATGDFQGLWEGWETGQLHRPIFHAFHQAVISTASDFRSRF